MNISQRTIKFALLLVVLSAVYFAGSNAATSLPIIVDGGHVVTLSHDGRPGFTSGDFWDHADCPKCATTSIQR